MAGQLTLLGRAETRPDRDTRDDSERMEAISRAATAEARVRELEVERPMLAARADAALRRAIDAERVQGEMAESLRREQARVRAADREAARLSAELVARTVERDDASAVLAPRAGSVAADRNVWELDDAPSAEDVERARDTVLMLARQAATAATSSTRIAALRGLLSAAEVLPEEAGAPRPVERSDRAAMLEIEAHPDEGKRGEGPSAAWFAALELDP
jgi:hypothetical protein